MFDPKIVCMMNHLSQPTRKSLYQPSAVYRSSSRRYTTCGLLKYVAVVGDKTRVVVLNHVDLQLRIMYDYHDAPVDGHGGREKIYLMMSRDLYWPLQY